VNSNTTSGQVVTHAITYRRVALVLVQDLINSLYPRKCSRGKGELG